MSIEILANQLMLARRHGLQSNGLIILCALDETEMQRHRGATLQMNTLAAICNCGTGNMTGLVSRMIDHGMLERFPDPKDRRCCMIGLTTKSRDLLRQIRSIDNPRLENTVAPQPEIKP